MASSLVSGLLVQHHHTCVTCVILGFLGSWSLIFSVVPVIVILQIVSQRLAGPLLGVERAQFGLVAILVERAVSAIATVKAFNAVSHEHSAFAAVIRKLHNIGWGVNRIWACPSGFNQFVAYGMSVLGFWFGTNMVCEGSAEPGHAIGVFWAFIIIAITNFQTCIPHLITLAKGKFASLIALMEAPTARPSGPLTRRPSVAWSLLTKRKAGSIWMIVCWGDQFA
jgi:ATP-binding cassette subfamily B (MDR/TAP) protein 1